MTVDNILGFRGSTPTASELVERVRELAASSANVDWSHPHFRGQLAKRKLTMRQALDVLAQGEAAEIPCLDDYGDWRIRLKKVSAGRPVSLVVALHDNRVVAVTII